MLDPDRGVVQADRVPAHDVQRYQLMDDPVLVDDEVGARSRQLVNSESGTSGANVLNVDWKSGVSV